MDSARLTVMSPFMMPQQEGRVDMGSLIPATLVRFCLRLIWSRINLDRDVERLEEAVKEMLVKIDLLLAQTFRTASCRAKRMQRNYPGFCEQLGLLPM